MDLRRIVKLAAVAALGWFWLSKKGASMKTSNTGNSGLADRLGSGVGAGLGASGVASSVPARKAGEVDYRVRYAAASTSADRRKVREDELRTARNTKTGVASDDSVGGIPLPYVTGAMKPAGVSQPALMALARYIRNGFKFEDSGIDEKSYVKGNPDFVRIFEDWRTRFGMRLEW